MRTFLVLIVIALVLVIVYFWAMKIWDNIKFDFSFKGIDLGNIDLSNIGTSASNIKLTVGAKITNDNGFSIPFRNLKTWLYYENTLIGQTSGDLASKSFNVLAHGNIEITDTVDAYLNSSAINLAKNLANHPSINYTLRMTIFWIPFSYSDSFTV